jgi:hypothetical protein
MPKQESKASQAQGEVLCPVCWAANAVRGLKSSLEGKLPAEFWEHRAAARREGLLALRSLVDAALARTEPAPTRKATRIKVE